MRMHELHIKLFDPLEHAKNKIRVLTGDL